MARLLFAILEAYRRGAAPACEKWERPHFSLFRELVTDG